MSPKQTDASEQVVVFDIVNIRAWAVFPGRERRPNTINGGGDYGFILTAIAGQVNGGGGIDKFRIKIWDKAGGHQIVYDNQMNAPEDADPTTTLGGGSIVIHKEN